MKVITDIPLLEKLQPFLGETEYVLLESIHFLTWAVISTKVISIKELEWLSSVNTVYRYKTVHLDEAMDLLPNLIWNKWLEIQKFSSGYNVSYIASYYDMDFPAFQSDSLLISCWKMLEYLIDNNLMK